MFPALKVCLLASLCKVNEALRNSVDLFIDLVSVKVLVCGLLNFFECDVSGVFGTLRVTYQFFFGSNIVWLFGIRSRCLFKLTGTNFRLRVGFSSLSTRRLLSLPFIERYVLEPKFTARYREAAIEKLIAIFSFSNLLVNYPLH